MSYFNALTLFLWVSSTAALAAQQPAPPAVAAPAPATTQAAPAPAAAVPAPTPKVSHSTADHTKFKQLDKVFASGPEVTKACLECHTEAAKQVQKTSHWTWEFMNPENRQRLGKKNVVNNFCTAVPSNYGFCTACHVGYDWKDENYDFTRQDNVDCLVCHDTTASYIKRPGLAGHPAYQEMEYPPKSGKTIPATDLRKVAQNVGKTSRSTCGACHFLGGGGDAVKHGDMDTTLKNPGRYLDVHMDAKGLNFTCATCHMTQGHQVPGSRYMPTAADKEGAHIRGKKDSSNPATCQACHGQRPHGAKHAKLDEHTDKVACQTCHIPEFARGQATKMMWDWSTAGKVSPEGKRLQLKDSGGRVIYDSYKGDARWESHVKPTYVWFNGKVNYTLLGSPVDPGGITPINRFDGSPDDGKSLIWPIKVFSGRQPYDTVTKSLVVPHTAGADDAAYWGNYDWLKAVEVGMKTVDRPFSGKLGFVSTEMYWPITHMVAPKEDALACDQCHARRGRLQEVTGIYMPGRDRIGALDTAGFALAGLALVGVLGHGGLRFWTSRRNGK
jgi:octaheme c-type cytochrome (tetrathionate reductase family)